MMTMINDEGKFLESSILFFVEFTNIESMEYSMKTQQTNHRKLREYSLKTEGKLEEHSQKIHRIPTEW